MNASRARPTTTRSFPAAEWRRAAPETLGFNTAALARAVNYAETTEIDWPVDVGAMVARADPPPHDRPIGPTKPRGPASGVVVKDGAIAAEWGTPERVDMTFSATKSYLAAGVGLAVDRGMIGSVDDPVADAIASAYFASERNRAVTWRHLLQQTSEWSGSLFGIPDSVDHHRAVHRREPPRTGGAPRKGHPRRLRAPGSYSEYNDVRVNALALAALRVWREPLPDVLRREVMTPIGAGSDWQWHAYDNAEVEVDSRRMPSVPGGAHWGGGLWISALDHARYALLMLAGGSWDGTRILSEAWVDAALTPCGVNPSYGFLWWLNTGRRFWQQASPQAFAALGAGGNLVCAVPEHELIVVTRWAGDAAGVVNRVIEALAGEAD